MDILNNDIGKMEIEPSKPWITEAMITRWKKHEKHKPTIKGVGRTTQAFMISHYW